MARFSTAVTFVLGWMAVFLMRFDHLNHNMNIDVWSDFFD